MRIGIIFAAKDVEALKARRLQAVAIAPACPVDEEEITQALGVSVFNLNDLIENGEMALLSHDCARFIQSALKNIALPPEALASQNDIYQYHLRKQYLFFTALKRFLDGNIGLLPEKPMLIFPFESLKQYESPMRPELNILFSDFRTLGYVAQQMANSRGITCEFSDHGICVLIRFINRTLLPARQVLLQSYVLLKLVKKIGAAGTRYRPQTRIERASVAIIVRTDSEVVSAHILIEMLRSIGFNTLIIQDELLASATTASRLEALGLDYIAVGAMQGFAGLVKAFASGTRRLRKRISRSIVRNLDCSDAFMGIPSASWARWMADRLFDFYIPQRHFAIELNSLIKEHELKLLITFAYVDQWGPVIQKTGEAAGIHTICVQNAAQDPEEYPRLAWSDHYCVESRYLKNELLAMGYPEQSITATGLPHYTSGLRSQDSLTPTEQKPAILLITQPIYHHYYVNLIKRLAPFCASRGLELHVKYHPRQLGSEYADVLEEVASFCFIKIFHRENLDLALGEAKLCISVVSAAILRAINLGVPTISYLPKSEKYLDLYYCSEKNLFVADTFDELDKILKRAMNDFPAFWEDFKQRRQHYLENHLTIEPSDDCIQNIMGVVQSHLSLSETWPNADDDACGQ